MEYKLRHIKPRDGYPMVEAPSGYPGAKYAGLYTYEHRAIWWLHYGYLPSKDFHIHHINGDIKDNRIENLEAVSRKEHSKHKHNGGKQPKQFIELSCNYCNAKFIQRESSINYRKSLGQTVFYCTKSCQVTVENKNKKGKKINYPKNRKRPCK